MTTTGSIDQLVQQLVGHDLQRMTAGQLGQVREAIDDIIRRDGLELAVRARKLVSGPPCAICGGPIQRKRRGRRPVVCGDECRKELARRRRMERVI